MKNNSISVVGTVVTSPQIAYTKAVDFYSFILSSVRLSGSVDLLNVLTSDYMLPEGVRIGTRLHITGQIRERSVMEGDTKHKAIYIFPEKITVENFSDDVCSCELLGNICKCNGIRTTPAGKTITDFILAIHRNDSKTDYLPCIAWGVNAHAVDRLPIGSELSLNGRLQSRDYNKIIDNNNVVKTVCEISVSHIN